MFAFTCCCCCSSPIGEGGERGAVCIEPECYCRCRRRCYRCCCCCLSSWKRRRRRIEFVGVSFHLGEDEDFWRNIRPRRLETWFKTWDRTVLCWRNPRIPFCRLDHPPTGGEKFFPIQATISHKCIYSIGKFLGGRGGPGSKQNFSSLFFRQTDVCPFVKIRQRGEKAAADWHTGKLDFFFKKAFNSPVESGNRGEVLKRNVYKNIS